MKTQTTEIRPFKWSSWDCEIWEKDGVKAIIWNEQKWADFEIQGKYSLIPIEFVDELKMVDPKGFMLNPEDKTDLVFAIEGDVKIQEVSDGYETVDFGDHKDSDLEYRELMTKYNDEEEYPNAHEVLDELGYQVASSQIIVKFYQRKLGE